MVRLTSHTLALADDVGDDGSVCSDARGAPGAERAEATASSRPNSWYSDRSESERSLRTSSLTPPGVTELGVVFGPQVSGVAGHPDYLH